MKKNIVYILVISVLLMAVSCANVNNREKDIKSEDLLKDVKKQEKEVKINGNEGAKIADFGLRVIKESRTEGNNTLISPVSIISAVGMTANGASGDTLAEFESTFGIDLKSLNNYLYKYYSDNSEGVSIANAIWLKDMDGLEMNKDFLSNVKSFFDASIFKSAFDETTKNDINTWVKKNTKGMIPSIVNKVDKESIIYLINAVAFDKTWKKKYKKSMIRDDIFTNAEGKEKTVKFLLSKEKYYIESDNAVGIIKAYDDRYKFVGILPKEGKSLSDLILDLDGAKINEMIRNVQMYTVDTKIPKFTVVSNLNLNEVLKNMGIVKAFNSEADFSKMLSPSKDIFISKVSHKTFIDLNENGTKAAAATSVKMDATSAPMKNKVVHLDRPFLYMIYDSKEDVPLFIGTIEDF